MHTNIAKVEPFARASRGIVLGAFVVFACTLLAGFISSMTPRQTSAATSSTINFQARLETSAGAVAPDGNYNVSFHLFSSSTAVGGTSTDTGCGTDTSCEWTEQYTYNSGAGSSDARIRVVNGYLTVNLGSLTAFSGINWNQQQWLTMDIGGTVGSGTITWDGQMSPRLLLTATPYAFQAGGLSVTSGSNTDSLVMTTPASASHTITVPDETGTICTTAGSAACTGVYAPASGGSSYVQLQGTTPGTAQTGNFGITGTGVAGVLQAATLDTASAGALGIGTTNATQITLNQNTVVASNKSFTANGTATFADATNSTTAFQVQNASGTPVLIVDTTDQETMLRALNNTAQAGSEMFTTSESFPTTAGWTSISGTGSSATATHTNGGGTSALSPTPALGIGSGAVYKVTYTVTGMANGSLNAQIGGVNGATVSSNTTQTDYITTTGTGNLAFVPTNNFDGTVSAVSVKLMSTQTPSLVVQDSTGTTSLELRVSTQSNGDLGLGMQSLQNNVGTSNTAVGTYTLQGNTSGTGNSAFGRGALQGNTTGSSNSAFGSDSLLANTTGGNNTAIGNNTLPANTYGNANTAVGVSSLTSNTSGGDNVGIGYRALQNNTTGGNNTGVGYKSLVDNTTGSNNSGLGYYSGYQGSQSDFLSSGANANATIVGTYAQATCSNCVILGGQGADQASIGLGTPNPTNFLSVEPLAYNTGTVSTTSGSGSITGSGTTFTASMVGDEIYIASNSISSVTYKGTVTAYTSATSITVSPNTSFTRSGAHYYILSTGLQVTNTGNVGIGTLSPQDTLDVAGTGRIQSSSNTTTAFQVQNASANPILDVDTTNGRVGIATATPNVNLVVSSSASAGAPQIGIQNTAAGGTEWYLGSTDNGNGAGGGKFIIDNSTTSANAAFAIDNSNHVSIGTTGTVTNTLTVDGTTLAATWNANAHNAFQIQDASTNALFTASTTDGTAINNATSDPGNLLENGGFESAITNSDPGAGASGWYVVSQGSIVSNSANAHSGNQYLSVTANGSILDTSTAKMYRVSPGDTIYTEGWVNTVSATGTGGYWVQFLDKNKANISWNAVGGGYLTAPASWTKVSGTLTAPANAAYINMAASVRSGTTGTWLFDDVVLKKINSNAPQIVNTTTNSTTAFQVQNASGTNVLSVDTTSNAIVLGNDGTPGALTVRGGAATGTDMQGSNITFDASNGTGGGGSGDVIFQTAAAASNAITLDNYQSETFGGNTNTTVTWTHTPNTSTNSILIVSVVTARNQAIATNGITYEGTALTKLSSQLCGNVVFSPYCEVEMWYMVNPATAGTHQINVTLTPGSTIIAASSITYDNINTTTPFGTVNTISGNTSANQQITNAVATTSTKQLVLDALATDNTTTNPGGTQLWSSNGNSFAFDNGSSNSANGGTTNVTWYVSSGDYADIAVPLNPVTSSTPDSLTDRLHITASGHVGINDSNPQDTLDVMGTTRVQTTANSTTGFQIQNASGTAILTVDTTDKDIIVGQGATGESTPTLLVLDSETGSSSDPTGITGAMYYNTTLNEFRCYTENAWEPCRTQPIDQSYEIDEEWISGNTATSGTGFGNLNWTLDTIGTACASVTYSGGSGSTAVSANRPGIVKVVTASSSGNIGCRFILGPSGGGTMGVGGDEDIKTSVALGATTANVMRVGMDTNTTGGTSTGGRAHTGVWWEADPGNNANWEYCYGNGSSGVCAASSTAIAANTFVRLEIQIVSSTAVNFSINGTKISLTGITLDASTAVAPNLACWTETSGTAATCYSDYFELRGDDTSLR